MATDRWAGLTSDVQGLIAAPIPRVSAADLTSLSFLREYVAPNRPVIITDALEGWSAVGRWDLNYFRSCAVSETEVHVNATPTGRGDCCVEQPGVARPLFVQPEERIMTLGHFCGALEDAQPTDEVLYLSHQNDNLRTEVPSLLHDINPLSFAQEAFGNEPEAINLWVGDSRAVSAVHKDHYENMYAVVAGQKRFTLLPPTDIAFMREVQCTSARYHKEGSDWTIAHEEDQTVDWIATNPDFPDELKDRLFSSNASPFSCCVEPGEVLYLPSMWYHQVSQGDGTIAVNFWHDMSFDFKFVFYNFVKASKPVEPEAEHKELAAGSTSRGAGSK